MEWSTESVRATISSRFPETTDRDRAWRHSSRRIRPHLRKPARKAMRRAA